MAAATAAGSAMSAAAASTLPKNFSGFGGALTSISVSVPIGLPLSAPSPTRRAVSLRPIIPAAPVIRMCMRCSVTLRCERSEPRRATARAPWPASFEARLRRAPQDDGVLLQRHAAVDEMRLAGNVACLVAGEEEGERRNFGHRSEPAHRLPVDEGLPYRVERAAGFLRRRGDAVFERGRFDRTRTNRIAADALPDKIGGDRLGEPDHRRLGRAVGISVGHTADRRYRR